MKKTLLASALMLAFSASAMAGIDGRYEYLEGAAGTVTEANNVGSVDRVLGGWRKSADAEGVLNSDVTVNGGQWNMVVGGYYVGDANGATLNVNSTKVVVESGKVSQLVGGSGGSDNLGLDFTGAKSSTVVIKGGEFGGQVTGTANCPELLVVGGDLLKDGGWAATANDGKGARSSIENVATTIENGLFDAAIIGGSAAIQYYGKLYHKDGFITATVDKATTTITGGTFNHAIVAGGLAYGHEATSTVETAILNISGANGNLVINENIYAGGLEGNLTDTTSSTVGSAEVNIDNAVLKNVYGEGALMSQPKGGGTPWAYESSGDKVSTKLSLTNVEAGTVKVLEGSVALRAEGGNQTKITEALTVGADVPVALTTDGATNDKFAGDISKAIVINGWDYGTADEVKMEEGLVMGEITMDENGKLVEKTNTVQLAVTDLAGTVPVSMARILTNDVRKRLGDIRSAEGTHGVWARYDGGKLSGEADFENKFHTIQVGIDTVPTPDSGRFGVAFSYTKGDSEFGRGESDMDAFSLAAYGTWMADNGMFADIIGRMATVDNDLTIDNSISGKTDNVLLSLSGEIGWRFNMTETFYVEPQAELTYTYVNSDRFSLGGVDYDVDATDSLVGRVGFAAGFKCPDNMGDVYVRASAVHEFLGDTAVKAGYAAPVEVDGEDTYVEFGIGGQFNVNKNMYIYADIERTEGAKLEEDWRANVGVRYAF